MKATAKANANIALVKYWGKKNKELNIPQNDSISVTLDKLNTTTTVEFHSRYKEDIFILNEKVQGKYKTKKISRHLNIIRQEAKIKEKAKVQSINNFPSSSGLASSSSAFAALSIAAAKAAGLNLDSRKLSTIARKGSGSACRSIYGGFVEWKTEENNDNGSFSKQILSPECWQQFRVIVVIVSNKEKTISSRSGMAQTVATSPMYESWLKTIDNDLLLMKHAIQEKNFSLVGKIAEANCLKMHSTMLTTSPPIIYWLPQTIKIIRSILEWREENLEPYFTIDAGPQVKILCLEKDVTELKKRLNQLQIAQKIIVCKQGKEALIIR